MERRVLIHAPLGQDAVLAGRVLAAAGIDSARCAEADLAGQMGLGVGALLLVEETLSQPRLQDTLLRFIAEQPAWSDLPILVLTKQGADSPEARRAVERLGNVTLLERPVRTTTLVSAARSALRARDRQYQVRTLNRRKDEFLATLAHELRNPLAPIRNAMGILERLHPGVQVASLAGMVNRQVDHLKRLVDDLMDVARITSGKLELQPSRTTVRQLVAHALEIVQADLQAKQHRLQVHQPAQEVVLHADPVRVVQSLANLLVNAAKFTPPSGEISLSVTVLGPQVEFRVRDSGKGLDAGSLTDIFEMFAQARQAGEASNGLGLGLHLTKAFAQLHGGQVSARSAGLGQGSEFILSLPVVVEPERAGAGLVTPPMPMPMPMPMPKAARRADGPRLPARILVVDDNPDAADTLETLLALHGVAVAVARDGASAVAHVLRESPDVVVMDIGMPVMDGYEAARTIRARLDGQRPVLIALTGWGQDADKARACAAGFDFHFVKPLDFDELLRCLSGVVPRQPA